MSLLNKVRVIVYRFHEKGLEIFLLDSDLKNNPDVWKLPKARVPNMEDMDLAKDYIEIQHSDNSDSEEMKTIAIEADWHDIPSIRGLLRYDVKIAKELVKEALPGVEKGAYFAIKEVMKKSMPGQYKTLKELKEILMDRNLLRYL